MSDVLDSFLGDLDRAKLRVSRPSRFIFLCGGYIPSDHTQPAQNLRDYLYRTRSISTKFPAAFILAESAQNLWRDTKYDDLINFEEDIARISGVVLVISESPGSLAELGAFSANDTIRAALRIIVSEENFNQESFVRYGPIERIRKPTEERVGVFPWRSHKKGHIVKTSVDPLFKDIKKFIFDQVKAIPKTESYSNLGEAQVFYDIFWMTSVATVISPTTLYESIQRIHPKLTNEEIRNKIYCMKVAGWMDKVQYSNKEYYYCKIDIDPFEYYFRSGVISRDSLRRKAQLREFFRAIDKPPATVYRRAVDGRKAMVPA